MENNKVPSAPQPLEIFSVRYAATAENLTGES